MRKTTFDEKLNRERFLTYDNGSPLSDLLFKDVEYLRKHVNNNFPALIVIDGGLGKGKTTLAQQIAETYSKKDLVLKEQLANGGDDFISKINVCIAKRHKVIIYDEAGDLEGTRALTRLNNDINRIFDQFRAFKILIILCLPNFAKLDSRVYDKEILQFLIHIDHRGITSCSGRVYDYDGVCWLKYHASKYANKKLMYNMQMQSYYFRALNLSPEKEKNLHKYSLDAKKNIFKGIDAQHNGLNTTTVLGKEFNVTTGRISQVVKELNIKPAQKVGNKRFYDQEAYNKISKYFKKHQAGNNQFVQKEML